MSNNSGGPNMGGGQWTTWYPTTAGQLSPWQIQAPAKQPTDNSPLTDAEKIAFIATTKKLLDASSWAPAQWRDWYHSVREECKVPIMPDTFEEWVETARAQNRLEELLKVIQEKIDAHGDSSL